MRNIIIILFVCAIVASPVACISRWFTAAFNDLKFTLYRYSYCVAGLQPLTSVRYNETEFLVHQIKNFLDQGHYDNEQLANVSSLMDTICRTSDAAYPISTQLDIHSFNSTLNPHAKSIRCRAIDDAMDSMYHVFKRAALNRSEPLDFSTIQFYPNETDKSASYNLSDLINTSWISSDVVLEHVCNITNATKEYVQARSSNSSAQSRQQAATQVTNSLYELIDRLLEPLLGLQKRLYWESTNRLEFIQTMISSGLGSVRSGVGHGLGRTRDILFWRRTNSTNNSATTGNVTDSRLANWTTTNPPPRVNSTPGPTTSVESALSPVTTTTTPLPLAKAVVGNRTATSTTTTV